MANPTEVSWQGATEREDNTPYTPDMRHGYNVTIVPEGDAPGAVVFTSIGGEAGNANNYSMPLADLGNPLTEGNWWIYVQDEDTDGRQSAWSQPALISWVIAAPKPPIGLVVS